MVLCGVHEYHYAPTLAQTPKPVPVNSMTPLLRFSVPYRATNALVPDFSLLTLPEAFARLDSSSMVPPITMRVYGASPTMATAARAYRLRSL
jgi:hypothetical protein